MAAHQALLSLGFSRQEHWSGLPFPSPVHESENRSTTLFVLLQNVIIFYFLSGFVSYRLTSTTASTTRQNRVSHLRAWRENEKNKNPKPTEKTALAKDWQK